MGQLAIGTCSWTDKELVQSGRFYPVWAKTPEDRLRYYATVFPTVEVDASFYALPTRENSARWVERTPDGFVFHVKAFGLFTRHAVEVRRLPKDLQDALPEEARAKGRIHEHHVPAEIKDELWRRFAEALLPLDSAGKLGVVVFQFPHWFYPGEERREYLLECQARLRQYRLAVEFRNAHWLDGDTERTLRFLHDHRLTFVCVDEPQGTKSSVPPVAAATTDTGYVRFHGRNRGMWEKRGLGTTAERFDHWYDEEELQEWVPKVRSLQEETRSTYLMFNTNRANQGPANARMLAGLLGGEGLQQGQLVA